MSNATNTKQLQIIVNHMEKCPDIANGFTQRQKEEVNSFWRTLEKEVNMVGPPMKSIFEWKKVWSDKKKYVRKKMSENLKLKNATGGGPYKEYKFSPIEEAIINVCAMGLSVAGSSDAKRFGLPSCSKKRKMEDVDDSQKENIATGSSQIRKTLQLNQKTSDIDEAHLTEWLLNSDDENVDDPGEIIVGLNDSVNSAHKSKPKVHQQKTNTTTDLLQKELQLQRELSDQIGEALSVIKKKQAVMQANVHKIYRSIDRLYDQQKLVLRETKRHNSEMEDLKPRQIQESQRHNAEMEKMRKQEIVAKLEHKQRLLEIEEEKLKRL